MVAENDVSETWEMDTARDENAGWEICCLRKGPMGRTAVALRVSAFELFGVREFGYLDAVTRDEIEAYGCFDKAGKMDATGANCAMLFVLRLRK